MTKTLGERVAALEERAKARDIEMRDMKTLVTSMDGKLDLLVARDNQQKGALSLGRMIAGTGIFTAIGGAFLTLWHRFIN